ncbi:hypothetical protein [Gymnodinialimonas ulvae]|uniref:hypothetical protein n=1 Tax=Gymnodinialimonas ulvae TaxID=3126504 RepID=UPI0030AC1664
MLAHTAHAGTDDTIPLSHIAHRHCPTEYRAMMALSSMDWDQFGSIKTDPARAPDINAAMNRDTTSVVAISTALGHFPAFSHPATHMQAQFDLLRVQFDLSDCLTLSEGQHDRVATLAIPQSDLLRPHRAARHRDCATDPLCRVSDTHLAACENGVRDQ